MTEDNLLQHVLKEINLTVAFDESADRGSELMKLRGGQLAQSRKREIHERDLRLHCYVLSCRPDRQRLVNNWIGSRSRQVGHLLFARGWIVAEQERVDKSARAERIARCRFEGLRK